MRYLPWSTVGPIPARCISDLYFSATFSGIGFADHMRGDEANIWKHSAPISSARATALKVPPAAETCAPICILFGSLISITRGARPIAPVGAW